MCGIVGIIGNIEDRERITKAMNDEIAHRGPDDEGFFFGDHVALAMRRLSIIDIAHGKQPISTADGRHTIVFNGEIYNYKILRDALAQQGYSFQTSSDTEVILALYQMEGEAMVLKLRGMFAFAIFDAQKKTVFVARDYFGIKPLYYLKLGTGIAAFGSEIKSLLKHPQYKREINDAAVFNYLSFQYNPLEESFFKHIYALAPGHSLTINVADGSFVEKKFWSFEFAPVARPYDEVKAEITNALKDSVTAHMVADVPVGSFLSGGIDSGIIAKLASDTVAANAASSLSTFTIGFKETNEWQQARELSDSIRSDHQEIQLEWKDYFAALPTIAWHFDEPVADPSAIALYFLAREARKKVKVVLSGEGADELFGGYNIYLEPYARRKLQYVPRSIRRFAQWLIVSLKIAERFPKLRGIQYLERSLLTPEEWYIGNATLFAKKDMPLLWKGEQFSPADLGSYYKKVAQHSDSVKMQYIDINTWLRGDILAKADKMSMANSLEVRVPFLDRDIAAIAATLTDDMKWRDGRTKSILRDAVRDIVPESTRGRKKLGFPTPINLMIADHVDEIAKIVMGNAYLKGHCSMDYVQALLADHQNLKDKSARKIFALLMFSIWHEQYFTAPPRLG